MFLFRKTSKLRRVIDVAFSLHPAYGMVSSDFDVNQTTRGAL